jgi:TolA-binding protein
MNDERAFAELGARFDAEDAAAPLDPTSTARVVERLLARPRLPPPAQRRPRRSPWVVVGASLFAASLAAAAIVGVTSRQWNQASRPSSPSALPRAVPAPSAHFNPAAVQVPDASARAEADSLPRPVVSVEPPPASPSATAAELLSAAGRARRSGEPARAITLLESLRARYPGSPEARASDITLGKLQLERGSSAAALRSFERYLAHSPAGSLAPEALWGRAQALERTGNPSAARQSLADLIKRYPASPYTSAARAKLGASTP